MLITTFTVNLHMHAEIEFWRVRNAAFSSLYEQLNLPLVKKYVTVLEAGSADQNLLTTFKAQFSELKKVHPSALGACVLATHTPLMQSGGNGWWL